MRLNQNTELGKLEEKCILIILMQLLMQNENIKKLAIDLEDKLIACLRLVKYEYLIMELLHTILKVK